ncbi:membrane-associating domain-containing protein [Aspergillus floccosus]
MISTTITRPVQLAIRVLQWASAVIVMGITSYFINKGPRGLSLTYQEIISVISVVFFLPAFVSPFMPTALGKVVIFIDVVFSYLWLTAFIFAAQDYNRSNCFFNAPPGLSCSKKKANEAFIFLTFIFTFFGMFLEVANLWAYAREHEAPPREKHGAHGGPADAPVDAPAPA